MKMLLALLLTACLLILTGCAVTKDVDAVVKQAQQITQRCNDPSLKGVASTDAIRNELKQKIIAAIGLGAGPAGTEAAPSVQVTLSDLKSQIAILKPEEKAVFAPVTTSWTKLKTDAVTIQTSLNKMFDDYKQGYDADCKSSSFHVDCYLDMANFAQQAAAAVRDDVTDLKTDADDLRKATHTALGKVKTTIDSPTGTKISGDIDALQHTVDSIYLTVDMIVNPSTSVGDEKMADAIKAAVEDDVKKYIAYEAAAFAMNELNRVARKVEVKLDEIDQKTWFILSGLDIAGTFLLASEDVNTSLSKMTPEKPGVTPTGLDVDAQYLLSAAAAYSCNRLGNDSDKATADASDTEVLLYPIYVELIIKAVPNTPTTQTPTSAKETVTSTTPVPVMPKPIDAPPPPPKKTTPPPKTVIVTRDNLVAFSIKNNVDVSKVISKTTYVAPVDTPTPDRLAVMRAALQANANAIVSSAKAKHSAAER